MTIAQVWYFASVHAVILLALGVSFCLVVTKSMSDSTFTLGAHGTTVLSFGTSLLVYLLLRILEAKIGINREVRKFVGHLSHLAGVLGFLSLVFLLSPITAACLAPIWVVWFFAVVSITLAKLMFPENHRNSVVNLLV